MARYILRWNRFTPIICLLHGETWQLYMQMPMKRKGGGVKQMPVVTLLILKGIYFWYLKAT